MSATVAPVLRSIVTTRLPASVTKSQGKVAMTPLGPAQSFAPAGGEHGRNPRNGGFAKACPRKVNVWASTTSTALFERSARKEAWLASSTQLISKEYRAPAGL